MWPALRAGKSSRRYRWSFAENRSPQRGSVGERRSERARATHALKDLLAPRGSNLLRRAIEQKYPRLHGDRQPFPETPPSRKERERTASSRKGLPARGRKN